VTAPDATRARPGDKPMIALQDVVKRYPDGTLAVDHLTLKVPEGEVCILVGPSIG
jgi:ABC-type proline/glycine betaine transport system ATPase subunit